MANYNGQHPWQIFTKSDWNQCFNGCWLARKIYLIQSPNCPYALWMPLQCCTKSWTILCLWAAFQSEIAFSSSSNKTITCWSIVSQPWGHYLIIHYFGRCCYFLPWLQLNSWANLDISVGYSLPLIRMVSDPSSADRKRCHALFSDVSEMHTQNFLCALNYCFIPSTHLFSNQPVTWAV